MLETEYYTLAPGEEGVANRTAQTAPKGATVIEIPFGANIWSIFPRIAIAAKAPDLMVYQQVNDQQWKNARLYIQQIETITNKKKKVNELINLNSNLQMAK